MPPKTQFSKDDIVETAFKLAAEDGLDAITARKVADRLGSSVAPIYHNFKDIQALKRAVVSKVVSIGRSMMEKRYTDSRFLDIGVASRAKWPSRSRAFWPRCFAKERRVAAL